MVSSLRWFARSFQRNGFLQTLLYLKNSLHLRYVRDWKKESHMVKKVHDFVMRLDVNDPGLSRTLAIKGTREQDQVYIVKQELKPGMTVLDIGANIGTYALLEAQLVGPQGKVYAIEPSPQNFDLLNQNVSLNRFGDRIDTFRLGASNQAGVGTFFLHAASNLHTFHPQKYGDFAQVETDKEYVDTIEVDVVNICDFARDKRPIDFIRMDIEGFEVEVLQGMEQGIMEGWLTPSILFESHRPKYDDLHHNMRAQLTRLFELGYMPKTLISTDESIARFHEKGYTPEIIIRTDGVQRGIYTGISQEDAIAFICDIGFVRAVFLEWNGNRSGQS